MNWNSFKESDIVVIQHWFNQIEYPVSDYNITHLTLWKDSFKMSYTWLGGFLFIRGIDLLTQQDFIYMPIGKKKLSEALWRYFLQNQVKNIIFKAITPEMFQRLKRIDGLECQYFLEREDWEYNYHMEKIAFYEGGDLRRKREMCRSFENKYTYQFEPYDSLKDRVEVRVFLNQWYKAFGDQSLVTQAEEKGIEDVLRLYEKLNCEGFLIKINEKVEGFILAEGLNSEILVVHYEKGNRSLKGIYDVMKRDLARHYLEKYRYLSLEEDMGIEGIRRAKSLYMPDLMRKKGTVICQVHEKERR